MGASTIFGRETDVEAVTQHLLNGRLVTLLGTGGIGKTTLARAVTDALAVEADWIDLARVDDNDRVDTAARSMLGTGSLEALAVAREGRPSLIVLDNCERVLAGAAAFAARLLDLSPEFRVLATSRVELSMPDEIRYRLAPLPVHGAGDGRSPAAELFVTRSREAGSSWPETPTVAEAIDTIVTRLDGLPLAIEMAAAQAVAIGPTDLVPLMDRALDMLVDRPTDGTAPRSLRAVIRSSYDRVGSDAQGFFRRLAPLGVPFDLELAASIAEVDRLAALDLINVLFRESLLSVDHDDDGSSRFRMLEPIRDFALDQLVDDDAVGAVEDRFVDVMAEYADAMIATAVGEYDVSVAALSPERFPSIVRAIEIAMRRDETPARTFRLVLPLVAPSSWPRDATTTLGRRILDRWPDDDAPLRAEALSVIGYCHGMTGYSRDAERISQAALDDPMASAVARLLAHRTIATTAAMDDRYDVATAHFEAALDEGEKFGGLFAREIRATLLGIGEPSAEALDELARIGDECAASEDYVILSWVLVNMISVNLRLGRLVEAQRCLDRAELAAARSPLDFSRSSVSRSRAIIETNAGDWPSAAASWRRHLEMLLPWGDIEGAAVCVRSAAAAAEYCGESDIADALWASRPVGRANTTLHRGYDEEDARLQARNGPPLPIGLAEAIERTRRLLPLAETSVPDRPPETSAGEGTAAIIRFGDGFELDLDRHELRENGEPVKIEPQVFDVLSYLARNAGRMVPKEELMDEVWATRFVSAAAVSSRIRSARAATGDDGRRQEVIRTVHGRGFEFIATLRLRD